MQQLEFFMDVSPEWWRKARTNDEFLKEYVYKKFNRDYYPRIISRGRQKIDLDKSGTPIKECILELLRYGKFEYEFFPEDENVKESYLISNGTVHFHPRRTKINSRLLIKVNL
ncbi:MAG: hypothetical protein R3327_04575 [Nitrosopumilaceae archaeon]|nr:hypothetical protein [Nitrosopumilaceae archaeon]